MLLLLTIRAQQTMSYPEVESTSYKFYQEGKWNELINYSKKARQQGIDFFYLQVRTGIAYYNLKKYRTASEFFLNAWENDQSFDWLQEYLYYSLLWGGRAQEAYKAAGNFSPATQKKIGFTSKKITRAGIEAGYVFNPDFDALTQTLHGEQASVGENYGEAFYLKDYHFESVDFNHRISPGISLNHNFTHINLNREQRVDWIEKNLFSTNTRQFQYFVSPNLLLGRKFYLSPSLNLIWGNFSYANGVLSGNNRSFGNTTVYFKDLVFSVSGWSHFGNLSPGAEYNYANINNAAFSQYSLWTTYYPFSNTGFYITPRIYFKRNKQGSFGYYALGVSGGIQLGPVHLYGQYINGEMENFIESGGYLVSNFPGTSKQKIAGSIYFPAGKKYQFVLRYINQDVTEKYRVYTNLTESNSVNYNYVKHTLSAGISWNF
ncbi:hypothetical protein SAMN05444274_105292 [Mariniphaga anaerophila]|uniref:Outer membrane protein, YaiO family n=2 Tax=Mariniphaga anaerophila TaxID=1484053 RepID=A0A1M5BSS1_9BACT|nr:hypothetical protein SAMN05444274_105292 [Mariniphaga anaerophila]